MRDDLISIRIFIACTVSVEGGGRVWQAGGVAKSENEKPSMRNQVAACCMQHSKGN